MSALVLLTGIDPAFMSDHALPFIVLKSEFPDRGPGYWCFDNEMLSDQAFVEQVEQMLKEKCKEYKDVKMRMEVIKLSFREISIVHKARKKKSDKLLLEALQKKQYEIQIKIDNCDISNCQLFYDCNCRTVIRTGDTVYHLVA